MAYTHAHTDTYVYTYSCVYVYHVKKTLQNLGKEYKRDFIQ
jgi:hypothetical protein